MARIFEPEHQWIDPGTPASWECAHERDKEAGHTTLYVIHSMLNDDTLYVGITGSVRRRFKQHSRKKPWWGESELANLECYDSWDSACEAEFDRIKYWKPVHNIIGNEMRRRLDAMPLCYVCGFGYEEGSEDHADAVAGNSTSHNRCGRVVTAAYEMGSTEGKTEEDPLRARALQEWRDVSALVQGR